MIYVHNILLACLGTFVRSIFLCFVTWQHHSPWHLHDKSTQNTHYSSVCKTFSHRIKTIFFHLQFATHKYTCGKFFIFSSAKSPHVSYLSIFDKMPSWMFTCWAGAVCEAWPSRVHYASVNRSMSSLGNIGVPTDLTQVIAINQLVPRR